MKLFWDGGNTGIRNHPDLSLNPDVPAAIYQAHDLGYSVSHL